MADTILDLANSLQTYVVAPLNAFGLGGYVFNVESESQADLSADITDHYTEDNKAIQDHIAIKPKRITLRGYVGELAYNTVGQSPTTLQTVTQKLTQLSAFLPALSASETQAQEAIGSVSGAVTSGTGVLDSLAGAVPAAANIYGLVTNLLGTLTGDTKNQQSAYQYFASCMATGTLMGVQTPWEFITNMAIERIVAIQPEESIFVTDFAVTFKQIRIAQTQILTPLSGTGGIPSTNPIQLSPTTAAQAEATVNLGPNPGAVVPTGNPGLAGTLSGVAGLATGNFGAIFKLLQ